MKNKVSTILLACFCLMLFGGWGKTGHKIANGGVAKLLPQEMAAFRVWNDFLIAHGSDADTRKYNTPGESDRHYIDIDYYKEFTTTGKIPQDLRELNAIYGAPVVTDEGLLPWATIAWEESLKVAFVQRNWPKAQQFAADLGHYVADAHNPLHITLNYDGQNTGQTKIHGRYESNMVDKYQLSIIINADSAEYVPSVSDFVFNYIYSNYKYVDSVLAADKSASGSTGSIVSDAYYLALWNKTRQFTNLLFSNASRNLSSLIYTAWVDAGKPAFGTTGVEQKKNGVLQTALLSQFPNPFNPSTRVDYKIPESGNVVIKVYNCLGCEVKTLVNEYKSAGEYSVDFDAAGLASGIYLCRLETGGYRSISKMILKK